MITKRLQEIFNIHAGEGQMVALVMGYAILLFSSTVLVTTASLGLFFGAYDAATLPYTYVLLMLFGPLVSLIVLRLNSRFTLARSLLSIHTFLLLSLILLPLLLNRSATPILRFSLPIYLEVFIALAYTSFWNLLGRIYNLRQGKRLFPLLLSGEHLATIGAGFVASFFVTRLGATNLFWLGALGMAGAIAILAIISRANASKMETIAAGEVRQARPSNLQTLIREPYVRLMLAVVALYTISVVMVQNLSYAQAEIRFPTEDGMATYVGIFMAIYGILGLILQWVIAGRLLDRFGVTVTLLAMPGGLFLIMLIFALVGSLNSAAPTLFWLASGANMYSYAIDGPYIAARNVMLQPLPASLRTQAQTTAIGFTYPLMTGMSGLLLVFLLDILGFNSVQLSYVILISLALWLAVAMWFGRAYVGRLQQALQTRRLSNMTPFRSPDRTSVSLLGEALQSPHPATVVYALDTLAEVAPEMLAERLPELLTYPNDGVRLAALRHIAGLPWHKRPPGVKTLLQSSSNPEVRAAALRTWHDVGSQSAGAHLSELSHDSQPAVRQAALAIMGRHIDPDVRRQASEALAALALSPIAADRVLAARVIGEFGDRAASMPQPAQLLLALLADRDPDVQRAALVAAAETRLPAVWPAVISALAPVSSRSLAANALVVGGEDPLPFLRAASREPEQDPQLLLGIAQVCGRIAGPQAIAILETLLEHPDSDVRRQAIIGLAQSTYQAAPPKRPAIQQAIHAQAVELAEIIAAQVDLGDTREVHLTADSLEQRRRLGTDNLLLLLSFLYEPQTLLSARDALQMGQFAEEKHAYAIEILDILLDHEDRALLLPLLHRLSPQQRLAKLQKRFPQAMLGRAERLRRLLEDGAGRNTRWTKICAIYALGLLADFEAAEAIIAAAVCGSDDAVLVETVLSSLEQLDVPLDSIAVDPTLETAVARWRARERQAMTLLQKAESLKRASIFANLQDDTLEAMAGLMSVVTVNPHETLMRKGDPGDCMYVIVDGQLRVHENAHIVDTLDPGDVTGEMALLAEHPEVARELLRLLSRRLRDRTADLALQTQRETTQATLPAGIGQPGARKSPLSPETLIDLDRRFILRSIDFFAGISDTLVGQVAALLEEVELAGGEVLFNQGDLGYSLFIVAMGQVRIHIGDRTLAYAGEGEAIGEMALLESEPRLASVTAVVPTRLLRLDQQLFFELLEDQPDMTRAIIKTLSGRQRDRLRELA